MDIRGSPTQIQRVHLTTPIISAPELYVTDTLVRRDV